MLTLISFPGAHSYQLCPRRRARVLSNVVFFRKEPLNKSSFLNKLKQERGNDGLRDPSTLEQNKGSRKRRNPWAMSLACF